MQKILTISIAAYNQEKYIEQALNSLIEESIIDDIEVFVVDDGGTDRTLDIAKQYAGRYPGSIFPVHKENGGYGTTVNYSIAHATGKYFKILDGDDWYNQSGLVQLVGFLKSTDADVIVTPYCEGAAEGQMRLVQWDVCWGKEINIEELHGRETFGMWALTYKTEAIRKSGMCLPGTLYIDQLYNIVPFTCCTTICFFKQCVYCYRVGYGGGQSIERNSRIKNTEIILKLCIAQCHFYEEQKEKGCNNLSYIRARICGDTYRFTISTLLWHPINQESIQKIQAFESEVAKISPDIYDGALGVKGLGKLLAILRKTNYKACWIMKMIPDGLPHKLWRLLKNQKRDQYNGDIST